MRSAPPVPALHLLGIASCLLLSWLLASRENWLGFAFVLLAALAYAGRWMVTSREHARAAAERARGPVAASDREQAGLKAELRTMRDQYERSRRVLLLLAVLAAGAAVLAWTWDPALALALLLVDVPLLALAWRRASAVRRIDDGLARAR